MSAMKCAIIASEISVGAMCISRRTARWKSASPILPSKPDEPHRITTLWEQDHPNTR
jgi:hypothetical protein